MRKLPKQKRSSKLSPSKIAGVYCLLGIAWILVTSFFVIPIAEHLQTRYFYELGKGVFYVLVTSGLLYSLCTSFSKQINQGQERYATYVAQSPIAIAVYNSTGDALDFNQAASTLTGYSREELLTRSIYDLDANPQPDAAKEVIAQIFEEGRLDFDWRIVRKDGSFAVVEIKAVVDGEQALFFVQDRTEAKAHERKLTMLNAMFRSIRGVNQAIVDEKEAGPLTQRICEIMIKDRDFNYAWIALFDSETDQLHQLSHAPSTLDSEALRTYVKSGAFPHCLKAQPREDSLIVSFAPTEECPDLPICHGLQKDALICAPLHCDNFTGHIALFVSQAAATNEDELSLFREVADDLNYALHSLMVADEKERAIGDLVVATRKAEAANEAKNQFLAVMSHEMRTPLNPIMGHCELLLEDCQDPDTQESLHQIRNGAEQLLSLVDDILYFISLQRGKLETNDRAMRIIPCCKQVLAAALPATEEIALRLENGDERFKPIPKDLTLIGDSTHLIHLLKNLMGNACKYTKQGGIVLFAGIDSETEDHVECIFQVRDSGIGIEVDKLDDLFTPFTQADYTYTRHYQGVGLGLATCQRIAEISGGSLKAESTLGVGSCFTYRCKFKRVSGELDSCDKQADHTSDTALKAAAATDGGNAHILIVEDNPSNALVTQRVLQRLNYQTTVAKNGRIGKELCDLYLYDAILMDLSMPVLNGYEAAEAIRRKDSKNYKTPIIALTAHTDADSKERAEKSGMNGYLTKPINQELLGRMLRRHLKV